MPKQKYQVLAEPNLVENYSRSGNPLYEAIEIIRQGFIDNVRRKIDKGLEDRARIEAQVIRRTLDASTYSFAQELSDYILRNGGVDNQGCRVIMLVEGTFYGNKNIKSIIPINLGDNPIDLFNKDVSNIGNNTIDDIVTYEKTQEFINSCRGYLSKNGYKGFDIDSSRFFYFRESDLASLKRGDGQIDMRKLKKLIPFITPTEYVVLDKVKIPSLEDYLKADPPPHISYRLKKSVVDRLLEKLSVKKGNIVSGLNYDPTKRSTMVDWTAFRGVLKSMDEVIKWQEFLESSPKLGKSKITHLYTKDTYTNPGETEFKAKKVVVEVKIGGSEPSIRELQFADNEQYWINEFKPGMTSHQELEKKREHGKRKIKTVREYFREHLENIFGTGEMYIPIEM